MSKSKIKSLGAAVGVLLLVAGCGSKTPESKVAEPDNAVSNILADEVEGLEKEVRLRNIENRVTELEQKLGEVQAKQDINDALAKTARDRPPVDAGSPTPAPE
jgi:outer membrane murein-binding lipoprotein Lpp